MSKPFVVDLVMNGAWLVRAGNGEYLDIVPGGKQGTLKLRTVPVSRVRHAFRMREVRDVRTREWSVTLEPVPLSTMPAAAAAPMRRTATGGRRAQMVAHLKHHGCMSFSIKAPTTPVPAKAPRRRGTLAAPAPVQGESPLVAVLADLPPKARDLKLEIDLASLLASKTSIPFPTFEGGEKQAYDHLARELGFELRSETLDEASLGGVERPEHIAEAAWKRVTAQLRREIHCRNVCRRQFDAVTRFVDHVFIANSNVVTIIGDLIRLDSNQVVHLVVSGMLTAVAKGIGAAPVPGAGIAGGLLDVGFKIMLRDRGPGEADLTVALNMAHDAFSNAFNDHLTTLQRAQADVFADWGKLQAMTEYLEANKGAKQWPIDDSALRTEARRLMQICLWKDLLKVKWHHMTWEDAPAFLSSYGAANKRAYEAANPNYWVEYVAGTGSDDKGHAVQGYFVTYHWLGYGSEGLWHKEAAAPMCLRLFDELQVPRSEVFTSTEWALPRERLHAASPGGGFGPPSGM
jgi:hypothetical protein